MNKKVLLFSILALTVITIVGASSVSAHGWFGWGWGGTIEPEKVVEKQNQMFEQQANLFGVDVGQIKNYWANGKNMWEIAQDLNISQEDLQAKLAEIRVQRQKDHLQILVDSGVINDEQADSRLQFMQDKMANGKFGRRMGMGFMKGFGCPCKDSQ